MKKFYHSLLFSFSLIIFSTLPNYTFSQNVGIGTAAPIEKLHVIGNIRSSTLAGVGNRVVVADPNGTLLPGATVTTGWSVLGNTGLNGGNTTTPGVNFLGTTDAQNICFRTNNVERGRFSALGEFFVGTLNTVIAGDLMNAVGNTAFPWAVNGYVPAGVNGGGVYGLIQSGNNTIYGGVQGEYNGTSASGAGVRGIAITITSIGVQGQEPTLAGWAGLFNGDVGAVVPGNFYTVSDKRLKTNIQPLSNSLEKIRQIHSYSYDANIEGYPDYISSSRKSIGFLAQELEAVIPEAVSEKLIPSLNTNRTNSNRKVQSIPVKAVSYDMLIPVLLDAIKEQQVMIDELQKKVNALEKK
jgi:hypothetical protein